MTVDRSIIGTTTGRQRVVVERGHVWRFAQAVKDDNPVYRDPEAAKAAGLDGPTVPPTYGFVLGNGAAYPELQSFEGGTGGTTDVGKISAELRKDGGLILHGEQEFEYQKPVVAGQVLIREGRVADYYQKQSGDRTMTFVVTEDRFFDEASGEPVLTTRFNLIHRS